MYGAAVDKPIAEDKTGWTYAWDDTAPSVFGAVSKTFTVQWSVNTYTIVFDANGGTGSMSNQNMTYDVTADLRENSFYYVGRALFGWSSDPNESDNVEYTDEQEVSNLTSEPSGVVTLYAVWRNPIVGDIAYSDGSFSTVYIDTKTPIGIVCQTDGAHGRIVHLNRSSDYLSWCLESADGYNRWINTSLTDGSSNWQIICDAVSDEAVVGKYPAFEYVNSLGDGWYLPAFDELKQIYTNKAVINNVLNTLSSSNVSVTTLGNYCNWSSSTVTNSSNTNRAWSIYDKYQGDAYRRSTLKVRAVRAF